MKKTFVNSLPKSGTNLVRRFLTLCGLRHAGLIPARGRVRRTLPPLFNYGYPVGVDWISTVNSGHVNSILRAVKEGELITAHVGYSWCFIHLTEQFGFRRLLVIRDPRAVLNSFVPYVSTSVRHSIHRPYSRLPEFERYRLALHGGWIGRLFLEPMKHRCWSLQPWLEAPDVLCVRFEDLVGARGGGDDSRQFEETRRIADWLEIPEDARKMAVETLFGGSQTFRSGQIDSWRTEIPAGLLADVNTELAPVLSAWGYEVDVNSSDDQARETRGTIARHQ